MKALLSFTRPWLLGLQLLPALGLVGCASHPCERPSPLASQPGQDLIPCSGSADAPEPLSPSADGCQAPSEAETLDLRQALALTLQHNPELAAFAWDVRAAEARELQAGLRPNPEASVETEYVSGNLPGFRESETTVALAQRLLFGGKRSRALRVAAAERELAGWAYETKRLDVFTDVVESFVALLGAQEKVQIAEESLRIADEGLMAAGKRVETGAALPVEKSRAEVAQGQAVASLQRARQGLQAARIALASHWASAQPRFTAVRGTLDCEVELPPLERLKHRLAQNPEVVSAALEVENREAALALERAKAVPDLEAMAGYRRIEGDDVNTTVFGFSSPLPLYDRNQGGIRNAEAQLNRAAWQRKQAEIQAQASLAEAHSELAAALEERRTYASRILPSAREAVRKTREGFEQGSSEYSELLSAQELLAQTRAGYLEVLIRLNTAVARVERLIAEPITCAGSIAGQSPQGR